MKKARHDYVRAKAAMTDGFKKLPDVSEDHLYAYLLGELSEPERFLVDQSLMADDELAERLQLAEFQLIDDYIAGELDARKAHAFETRFLKTGARREQLRLTAALREYSVPAASAQTAARPAVRRSWREGFREFLAWKPGPAWAAAGSFALLVLVLGVAWYWSRQSRSGDAPVARQPALNATSPAAAETPAVAQVPPTAPPPPQLKPTPSEPPVAVGVFVLTAGALRGSGAMNRVAVPRGERDVLRLVLILENPTAGPYRAELANADGQTVTVRDYLRPRANGRMKISVDIPARLIQTGDYQIKLARRADGQLESVGRYYFRALQE